MCKNQNKTWDSSVQFVLQLFAFKIEVYIKVCCFCDVMKLKQKLQTNAFERSNLTSLVWHRACVQYATQDMIFKFILCCSFRIRDTISSTTFILELNNIWNSRKRVVWVTKCHDLSCFCTVFYRQPWSHFSVFRFWLVQTPVLNKQRV